MRDKLIEILEKCEHIRGLDAEYDCADIYEHVADYLLANGAIVLPIKVGDMVYIISECSCENIDGVYTECEFYGYGEYDRICTIANGAKCPYQYRIEKCTVTECNLFMFSRLLGDTAFLSPEEADKALERSKS